MAYRCRDIRVWGVVSATVLGKGDTQGAYMVTATGSFRPPGFDSALAGGRGYARSYSVADAGPFRPPAVDAALVGERIYMAPIR